jgi:hypothetical protein
MSVRNQRTGRHEDDLALELFRGGQIPLSTLIDHLNEIVVEDVSGQSENVRTPVKMATLLLEALIARGILEPGTPITL